MCRGRARVLVNAIEEQGPRFVCLFLFSDFLFFSSFAKFRTLGSESSYYSARDSVILKYCTISLIRLLFLKNRCFRNCDIL